MNRCRKDPVAEAYRLLNSNFYFTIIRCGYHPQEFINEFSKYYEQPPMNMNKKLLYAARIHAIDLATNRGEVFGHFGSDGSSPAYRVKEMADYEGQFGGENVYDGISSSLNAHNGFIIDGEIGSMHGHRHSIINDNPNIVPIVEAGMAMVPIPSLWKDDYPIFSCVQDLGIHKEGIPRLCGVVYNDVNHNDIYDSSEGIPDINIQNKEGWFQTITSNSGGYSLPLPSGKYQIQFTDLNGIISTTRIIEMETSNKKLDLKITLTPIKTPKPVPTYPSVIYGINLAKGQITNGMFYTFDGYGNWEINEGIQYVVDSDIITNNYWKTLDSDLGFSVLDISLSRICEIERNKHLSSREKCK